MTRGTITVIFARSPEQTGIVLTQYSMGIKALELKDPDKTRVFLKVVVCRFYLLFKV